MNAVMVDTSVWVDHFRNRNDGLVRLLHQDMVLMHPMILGEIACGTPPSPRSRTLADLDLLPAARQASLSETMTFIERHALFGAGCGLVDMILLASTLTTPGASLWTLDRRLHAMAGRFGVAHTALP